MQRLTISLDDDLAVAFDALQQARGYVSRSEAVRDIVRRSVDAARHDADVGAHCVASLSYVYDFRIRSLAVRLLALQHDHHDLVAAATHIILDHQSLLQTIVLHGPTGAVRALADRICAERGVRYGAINLVGVSPNDRHGVADKHHHDRNNHASLHPG